MFVGKTVSSIFEGLGHKISVSEVESNKNLPSMHDFTYLQNILKADHISATLFSIFHFGIPSSWAVFFATQ